MPLQQHDAGAVGREREQAHGAHRLEHRQRGNKDAVGDLAEHEQPGGEDQHTLEKRYACLGVVAARHRPKAERVGERVAEVVERIGQQRGRPREQRRGEHDDEHDRVDDEDDLQRGALVSALQVAGDGFAAVSHGAHCNMRAMPSPYDKVGELPVHRLRDALASGDLTCAALVDGLLARIARDDPKLHAFVHVYAEEARAAAAAADAARRAGQALGPLHGIPVAVKDIVDIEGRITTGGSKVWQKRVSPLTATLVQRMLAAGMIVLGKTHLVEFAMGSFGTNRHMGTPWNPHDPATHRAPGGSSSGTGVAVAAGMAPWGIGTDTGGSVRIPASWCGITGLKTTIGRVSCHGVLPLSTTLDTPGPMARSVEDAALLYNVLAGPDPNDPLTLRRPPEDPMPGLKSGVRGLRLARMPAPERAGCEPGVLAAYDASLGRLAGGGRSSRRERRVIAHTAAAAQGSGGNGGA